MSWEDEAKAQSEPMGWEDSARAQSVPEQAADAEAARPRNIAELAWYGARNMAAGGAKALSGLAAGAGGLVAKALDKARFTSGLEDAAKVGHARMDERIDRALGTQDPTTGGALMQTLGNAGTALAIPAEKAIPYATGALQAAKLPAPLARMLGRTAVNTGLGAVEGEAVGSPGTGALIGAVGSGVAEAAKALGGQIIKSYIKGGHRGAAEGLDIPWLLENNYGGTHAGMVRKVDSKLSELRAVQDAVVTRKGNLPTPVLQALQNVENRINSPEFAAANLGAVPAARAQLQDYVDDLIPIANPQTGEAPLKMAWDMKKKAGSDAAQLYRMQRAGNGNVRDMTKQGVSAMVATEIGDLLEKQAPEMTLLNPEFSKLIPAAKALERRGRIAGQHNPMGLDELAALETGVNFMLHGHLEGGLLPIAQKASKSPGFGQAMRWGADKSTRLLPLIPPAADLMGLSGEPAQ